jgi:lipopolysaccharide transport system permease protein
MSNDSVSELWRFRELFYFLAWRDVKIRYKQTVLGVAWAVLQPLLTMFVFLILFNRVARVSTNDIPAPLFYYCGLVPWTYFSVAIGLAANSVAGNANLLTKVYFPRSILPGSAVLSGLVDFLIGGSFIIGFLAYYRIVVGWQIILLPALTVMLVMITYGCGLFLAALTVKYRDVKYAVPFAVQLGLFLTPVIYPLNALPPAYRKIAVLNPLAGVIDGFRAAVTSAPLDWTSVAVSAAASILLVTTGAVYFGRTERAFADVI